MMCKLSCMADAQPASPSAGGGGSSGTQGEPGGQRAEDRGARAARAPPAARGLKGNWEALWAAVAKDHCHAGLIWNETTRAELREALQVRAASLPAGKGMGWRSFQPCWSASMRSVVTRAAFGKTTGLALGGAMCRYGVRLCF